MQMHERIRTMICLAVMWIRDILVRIRILESVPLSNGSGKLKNIRILQIRIRIHNTVSMLTKPSVERAIFLCLYSGESRRPETAAMWPYNRVSN